MGHTRHLNCAWSTPALFCMFGCLPSSMRNSGNKDARIPKLVGEKSIFAAFLIDPVDCPCFAPCSSACYPSALEAVAASARVIGVSGALTKGCCNPTASSCGWLCAASCYAATGNRTCTGNDYEVSSFADHAHVLSCSIVPISVQK
jgi:hypothetical protein